MHTTIAAAADWYFEASLSEANFQYFWLVTTLQENEKNCPFVGAPFMWGPLFGRTCFGWGDGGNVTSAGWQVTLCDPKWHVSSRTGEQSF